jgi:hypothetical protein
MGSQLTCPKCGAVSLTSAPICACGFRFSGAPSGSPASPSDATKSPTIERPFDIGKPLGTPYRVSTVCPSCGSSEHEKVKPAAMVAFARDRVCRICSTRYTPPTPIWGRLFFGVIGLAAVAFGCVELYDVLVRGTKPSTATGNIAFIVAVIVGVGCLYKAATK